MKKTVSIEVLQDVVDALVNHWLTTSVPRCNVCSGPATSLYRGGNHITNTIVEQMLCDVDIGNRKVTADFRASIVRLFQQYLSEREISEKEGTK